MRPPGAFKIAHRARTARKVSTSASAVHHPADLESCVGPLLAGDARSQRILDSLRNEIIDGADGLELRIRLVFREPREIFRLELELPSLGYQRTTLLDRDALEQLMEADDVGEIVRTSASGL